MKASLSPMNSKLPGKVNPKPAMACYSKSKY